MSLLVPDYDHEMVIFTRRQPDGANQTWVRMSLGTSPVLAVQTLMNAAQTIAASNGIQIQMGPEPHPGGQ